MNPDFFNLNNSLQASSEFLDNAYPKCKEAVEGAAKMGGVIVIGASLTLGSIPKPVFADEVKPKPQETAHSDERENAGTFWIVTGTSNLSGDSPMILDRNLSQVEKSLHGINGSAEPHRVYEWALKKGGPLEIRSV